MESWRLLDTGMRSAAENMALDSVILDAVSDGEAPNTIRFLRFSRPCVLVGYHQDVDQEVRLDYCIRKGIEVNRRITGGGALYFDPIHLGWEIVAKWSPPLPRRMEDLTEFMCETVARALRNLGIKAKFRGRNDIEVEGRKISGSGGTSQGDAFLFQGTLLTDLDVHEMLMCLKIPIEKLRDKGIQSIKDRITTIKSEIGYVPEMNLLKTLIAEEFSKRLEVSIKASDRLLCEEELLTERLPYFCSDEWIHQVKVPKRGFFHATTKTPGGLIRAAVNVHETKIYAAYITGDFFVYPQKVVYEIESRLKQTSIDEQKVLKQVRDAIHALDATLPGVPSKDIARSVLKAASRIRLLDLGLTAEEADELIEVLVPIECSLTNARWLLLPYCAKPLECELRHGPDCVKCGSCDFTTLCEVAEGLRFKPMTIINYEHLEQTLIALKDSGERAWLGSCCPQFYEKHIEDFERIGLPGLIVTTDGISCYELGEEGRGYAGEYEGLSKIRTELIIKILKLANETRK